MGIFGNIKISDERKETLLKELRKQYLILLFNYPFFVFVMNGHYSERITKLIEEFPEFYKNNSTEIILEERFKKWKSKV